MKCIGFNRKFLRRRGEIMAIFSSWKFTDKNCIQNLTHSPHLLLRPPLWRDWACFSLKGIKEHSIAMFANKQKRQKKKNWQTQDWKTTVNESNLRIILVGIAAFKPRTNLSALLHWAKLSKVITRLRFQRLMIN